VSGQAPRPSRRAFLGMLGAATVAMAARIAALPAWQPLRPEEEATPPAPPPAARPAAGRVIALTPDEPDDHRTAFRHLDTFGPAIRPLNRLRINTVEPRWSIDLGAWRLRVDGLVARPLVFDYAALRRLPATRVVADFYCVEGWSVRDLEWVGVKLSTVLDLAEPLPEGRWVNFFTFPGVYRESLSLEQARMDDVILAYQLNGQPLPPENGWPLRLLVPQMYGYKSAKWLDRIEVIDRRQLGYWERRGWPPDPWIR